MNAIKYKFLPVSIAVVVLNTLLNLQAQTVASVSGVATNSVTPDGPAAGRGYASPLIGKIYFGFDAGVAWQQNITLSDSVGDHETVTFDPGARFDMEMGYNITKKWATELELGFIINPVKYSYVLGTDYVDVNLIELPLMVNVIYSQPLGKRCSVYAGGGVGGVFIHYQDQYNDTTPTAAAFGYQGLAGFKFALSSKWDMGVGYKFLGTTGYDVGSGVAYDGFTPTEYKSDGNMTQSILLTFTCKF